MYQIPKKLYSIIQKIRKTKNNSLLNEGDNSFLIKVKDNDSSLNLIKVKDNDSSLNKGSSVSLSASNFGVNNFNKSKQESFKEISAEIIKDLDSHYKKDVAERANRLLQQCFGMQDVFRPEDVAISEEGGVSLSTRVVLTERQKEALKYIYVENPKIRSGTMTKEVIDREKEKIAVSVQRANGFLQKHLAVKESIFTAEDFICKEGRVFMKDGEKKSLLIKCRDLHMICHVFNEYLSESFKKDNIDGLLSMDIEKGVGKKIFDAYILDKQQNNLLKPSDFFSMKNGKFVFKSQEESSQFRLLCEASQCRDRLGRDRLVDKKRHHENTFSGKRKGFVENERAREKQKGKKVRFNV